MVLSPGGTEELIGYFPFLEGVAGPLFAEGADPSERSAHFTFRSSPFRVSVLRNDPIYHLRTSPAEGSAIVLRTYFHARPSADFSDPETFSAGQLTGEFQARGSVTTVIPFTSTVNTGSFTRISSAPFTFGGRTYDFSRLAETITVQLQGAPLDLALGLSSAAVPFGGTATAAAWRTAAATAPY